MAVFQKCRPSQPYDEGGAVIVPSPGLVIQAVSGRGLNDAGQLAVLEAVLDPRFKNNSGYQT